MKKFGHFFVFCFFNETGKGIYICKQLSHYQRNEEEKKKWWKKKHDQKKKLCKSNRRASSGVECAGDKNNSITMIVHRSQQDGPCVYRWARGNELWFTNNACTCHPPPPPKTHHHIIIHLSVYLTCSHIQSAGCRCTRPKQSTPIDDWMKSSAFLLYTIWLWRCVCVYVWARSNLFLRALVA